MNEDEDTFDVWGLQDVLDAQAEMRAYLVQTVIVCFATVLLCEAMTVMANTIVTDSTVARGAAFLFTAIAVGSAVVALVQTANRSAEIIRLGELVTWATKGDASCRAS